MNADPKRFAKVLLGQALVRSGLWKRSLRMWAERDAVIIFAYHRVIEKWDETLDYSQPGMVVTASTFDRHVAILKEHFQVVTLDALLADGNTAGRAARPRCVVTFDDGWRDNYDLAFPILSRHEIPATIFLTADFIGTDRAFWHTELMYLLTSPKLSSLLSVERAFRAYPDPVRHHLKRLARLDGAAGAQEVDPLIETVKRLCDDDAIEELVHSLAKTAGTRRPLVRDRKFFLDWDQVRTMAAAGIEIGSHGCSHRILTRLSAEQADDELSRSKAEIEHRIGRKVKHFAFPNDDASGALLNAAATAGYRTACFGGGLVAGQRRFGIRSLRRLGMHEKVCGDGRSFDEALFHYWMFRAPKERA
jgi:peptidoglycan/xylan/chitin deacetylase (PgdA/CDA1 family)